VVLYQVSAKFDGQLGVVGYSSVLLADGTSHLLLKDGSRFRRNATTPINANVLLSPAHAADASTKVQASASFVGVGGVYLNPHNDPRVFNTAYQEKEWDEDEQDFVFIQEALFTNLNNAIELEVDGPSLVGRWLSDVGPAQRVPLSGDLSFAADGSLQVNWGGLNTITSSVASLQARVTALEASDATQTAQIATLQGQVAALQASLAALQIQFDLFRQTVRFLPTAQAALSVVAGMPVVNTSQTTTLRPPPMVGQGAFAVAELKTSFISISTFAGSSGFSAYYQPPLWLGSATFAVGSGLSARGGLSWSGFATFAPAGGMPTVQTNAVFRPTQFFQGLGGFTTITTQRGFLPLPTLAGTGSINVLAGFVLSQSVPTLTGVGGLTAVVPAPQRYTTPTTLAGAGGFAANAGWIKGIDPVSLNPVSTLTANTRFVYALEPITLAGSGSLGVTFLNHLLLADGTSHLRLAQVDFH